MADLVVISFKDEQTAFALAGLKDFTGKGKVLQTSLTKDKEDALRKVIEGTR